MEQCQPETTKIVSYMMARSARKYKEHVWFGLQYYLHKYLCSEITHDHMEEFLDIRKSILGGPTPDKVYNCITGLIERGHWALRIKALPEGSVVPVRTALLTSTNTEPGEHWQVGFTESLLLKVWYSCSVATMSREYRILCRDYAAETCDNMSHVPFQVHDFGYRGCSSEESAAIGGAAHLTQFRSTDTIAAVQLLRDWYFANDDIGVSVPASEHFVMCSFGRENEYDAFVHMLRTYPTGIVSIVADTYNLWTVLTDFAERLKPMIMGRNGKVVFRPDSGDPELIICGDSNAPKYSPEWFGAIRLLDKVFGSTMNSKGYRVLNPAVGLIYGDGMYYERFERILRRLKNMGYASSNLVIGVGGILLQQHNRDDLGFAFKAIYAERGSEGFEIYKDPITDSGKKSHKGLIRVTKDSAGNYITEDGVSWLNEDSGLLQVVFENGKLRACPSLSEIRSA